MTFANRIDAPIVWAVDDASAPPCSVLTAQLTVCGIAIELIALEVLRDGDDGMWRFANLEWEQADLGSAFALDGPPETFTHEGRRYTLFACPHCE